MHRITSSAIVSLSLLLLPGLRSHSEAQGGPPTTLPSGPSASDLEKSPVADEMRRNMAKKANEQRQAALKRDTEKLLKLSTELKEHVEKTNENILSLDVIKKAEEIEKLAHSIRVKMRGEEYGGADIP